VLDTAEELTLDLMLPKSIDENLGKIEQKQGEVAEPIAMKP